MVASVPASVPASVSIPTSSPAPGPAPSSSPSPSPISKSIARLRKKLLSRATLRAIISLVVFVVLWEVGSRSKQWLGFALPWIGQVPAPSGVLRVWAGLLGDVGYWQSWYLSLGRVLAGFIAAMLVGIPLGLLMAVSKTFYGLTFPSFEMLRPIPPLAWVPISIIFWPTQELSIAFVERCVKFLLPGPKKSLILLQ